MATYYCPGNSPFTCIEQTILGLLPFASLFYFYWIINKYIKAEGYSLLIPPYQLTHVLKLLGSILSGVLSLARIILEIAMAKEDQSILFYIIYTFFIVISVVMTYLIRQEYNFLGYTTPFLRTFMLFFSSCYGLMLILSEIFPDYENDTSLTAKEVIQVLILADNLTLLIICYGHKSDVKNPQHDEIADFGFKLRQKYSSSLIKKANDNNDYDKEEKDLEKQLLRQSIQSEFLSQTSGPSQLKTIQSNEFSYFDRSNISKVYKVNLESVGVQSIKVMYENQAKDQKTKKQIYTFKIQVKTKTEENHETLRNLTEFIDYIKDIKQFLQSLQFIIEEVQNFDQNTKDKTKITQLATNLQKILKYVVENNYMNIYFYQLTQSNYELFQYGKDNSIHQDHQNTSQHKHQSDEIKETDSENKSENESKKSKKKKERDGKKEEGIKIISDNLEQVNQNQEIQEEKKELSSDVVDQVKRQNENETNPNQNIRIEKNNQNKQQENDDDVEESKEINEKQINTKDFEYQQSQSQQQNLDFDIVERSQSFTQIKDINEINFQNIPQSQNNLQQRSQSNMPSNLTRNSFQQFKASQKPKEVLVQKEFFQVQFIESKQIENFTAYIFKIKEKKSGWESVIQKRYSQFEKLHNQLKAIAKTKKIILPNLPYKNEESGLFTSNKNQNLIEFRSKELKQYLQNLLLDKGFKKEQALLQFINFEKMEQEIQNKN